MRMSSVRSWSSLGGGDGGSRESTRILPADVVKTGYLKKLKTMRKKFFVLRGDSADTSARLEYYDSEKKWKAHQNPKRSITLKTCFNINRRSDIRQKHVIALYTKNDCFCVVLETEEELEDWLKALLSLQQGEDMPDGELPKPTFEHVWQVNVQKKELGNSRNILGPYHLCLTDRTLSLVKRGTDKPESIEFSLQSIRRCGHLDSFFYMEVGQASVTGAGNLWMQTEDPNIAQNMHDAILSACSNCSKKDLAPKSRNRSSSANEASKPITVMQRWPTHAGLTGGVRERCDSLPSRARTTSEGAHQHLPHPPRSHLVPSHSRPHSMYNRGISYSPPVASSPVSPASGACSTDSAGSSLSMDGDGMGEGSWGMGDGESGRYGHSLTPDEPVIMEENCDDYAPWPAENEKPNNYVPMDGSLCLPIQSATPSGNAGYRKYSPNPNSGFKSSSPSQGSGIDMYSPCGSSPLETPSTYMPMSPIDGRTPVYGRTGGSANHSRGSSLADEGYVPMARGDGYVDVASVDHSNHHQFRSGDMSPGGSSCSITSGTPSTDIRFSEYTLEKVSTYFTPSEDEIAPNERPARAYSVGSRPGSLNTRPETANHVECRVRAFSVGSRSIPRGRAIPYPHLTPPARHLLSSSHSSVEPSEDLMELDFTRNKTSRNRKTHSLKKLTSSSSERLIPPSGSTVSSAASSYSTAEGSYMDPSPRGSPKPSDNESDTTHVGPSPPKTTRVSGFMGRSPPKTTYAYMDMKPGHISSSPPISSTYPSPPLYRVPEGESGYVVMHTDNAGELLPGTSPPVKSLSASPKGIAIHAPMIDGYMEMKPGGDAKHVTPKSAQPRVETFPVTETIRPQNLPKTTSVPPPIKQALLTTQALSKSKTGQEDYLDMTAKRKISLVEDNNNSKIIGGQQETPNRTMDDYVPMAVPANKPFRKSSLESVKVNNTEDYMNMSGGSLSGHKRDRRGSRNDRNRYSSQPITIQSANISSDSASTSPVFSFAGRKHSTGTPPKIPSHLPLGNYGSSSPSSSPYSSLPRTRQRKQARRESKDLNSSALTTPTGSDSAIFPISLNSPGSPLKPFSSGAQSSKDENESSKCSVDATSGTVKITSSPMKEINIPVLRRNVTGRPDDRDYVNYSPRASQELSSDQDYTVMNPINTTPEPARKVSVSSTATPAVSESVKTKPVDRLVNDITNLSLVTQSSVMPVPSGSRTSDTSNTSSENTRLTELNGSDVSSRSGEQTVVSRTPSVSSVGQKELHYASLDLRSNSECDDGGGGGGSAAGASGGGGSSHVPSLKSQSSLTESSSASTPSPNLASDAPFPYAELDFDKIASSQQLRH